MSNRAPKITLRNVEAHFGAFSLKDVNLEVEANEYHVLLGPTGAGKTLILELIAGFHHPSRGNVFFCGQNVAGVPPNEREIGFVYQDYSLFPHLNVQDNIAFGLRVRKLPPREVREQVDGVMGDLGISHLKGRAPYTLSGGEQQKVALARALVVKPSILLLDEPFSAMDPVSRKSAMKWIKRLHEEKNLTTVQVTHDQDEALLGDRVSLVMEGTVVETGTPKEVFNAPRDERVAAFVGVENIVRGEIVSSDNGYVTVDAGGFEVKCLSKFDSGPVTLFIRPENVIISLAPLESSLRNSIRAKVREIFVVSKEMCQVTLDNDLCSYITVNARESLGLNEGDDVYASFKAAAVALKRS
ncbi:MAG: ABC transporter ATP-binding protein [Promethearchaeota archaeon]